MCGKLLGEKHNGLGRAAARQQMRAGETERRLDRLICAVALAARERKLRVTYYVSSLFTRTRFMGGPWDTHK